MKIIDKFLNLFRPVYHISKSESSSTHGKYYSFTIKALGKPKSKTLLMRDGRKRIYIYPDGSIEFKELE